MDQNDVISGSSPIGGEDVITQTPVVTPEVVTPAPGSQTPSENLLKALQEERELRRIAEAEAAQLRQNPPTPSTDDVYSDEGRILKGEMGTLEQRLKKIEDDKRIDALKTTFPALNDKAAEFEEYRKDFPDSKLDVVAKLFLTEKGLLDVQPERKGLEQPSGGGRREPTSTGLSSQEVKELRENNYKKYLELLHAGKLDDIK